MLKHIYLNYLNNNKLKYNNFRNLIFKNYMCIDENPKKKRKLNIDQINNNIINICTEFKGKIIKINAFFSYDNETTPIVNNNLIGNILENIFFSRIKKKVDNFSQGPKQNSPDYYINNDYEYEQKVYINKPNFDIGNYESYINQLANKDGVYRKLYKTKYLVFEYDIIDDYILIKDFKILNIWNIVGYDGKYPITIQNKRGTWYNIRSSSNNDWDIKDKTPEKFIKNIILSIKECPNNISNKDFLINSINKQFELLINNVN